MIAIPSPLQSVQGAEYGEERCIFALQAFTLVHLGIDNTNVFNGLSRLLAGSGGYSSLSCERW